MFDDRRFLDDTKKGVKPGYPTLYSASQVFNKETLGFRVDTADEIAAEKQRWRSPPVKVANIEDYIKALVGFMVDTANKTHLHDDDWHRTVFIDAAGISATDFGLSPAQIKTLIANGVQGTTAYLKWFTNAKAKPLNR
jgi:NTE family protein